MKSNRRFFKFSAILALSLSAILFLPEAAVGKGDVIGYASGDAFPQPNSYPTNEQLDRLTHVMAVDLYPNAQGYLYSWTIWGSSSPSPVQWNQSQRNQWLDGLVSKSPCERGKGINCDS